MDGKYLLDTNIVIALFAADTGVVEKLEIAEEVFVPSVVIGELSGLTLVTRDNHFTEVDGLNTEKW